MALFKADDLFSYRDANEIKKLWASDTPPINPGDGEVWLDTTVSPCRLKRYKDASEVWETIAAVRSGTTEPDPNPDPGDSREGELFFNTSTTPPQLKIFNSGAWEALEVEGYIRSDQDDTFTGILTSTKTNGAVLKFDNGHSMIAVNDSSGLLKINSGVDESDQIIVSDGGAQIRMDETGVITIATSTATMGSAFTDTVSVAINGSGITMNGTLRVQNQILIPQSEPAGAGNGSIWMV